MPAFEIEVTAADDWSNIADLASNPGIIAVLREGFIGCIGNDARFLFKPTSIGGGQDPAGVPLPASSAAGLGPVKDPEAGYPLQTIYVKNAVAGSNATIQVTGQVF